MVIKKKSEFPQDPAAAGPKRLREKIGERTDMLVLNDDRKIIVSPTVQESITINRKDNDEQEEKKKPLPCK